MRNENALHRNPSSQLLLREALRALLLAAEAASYGGSTVGDTVDFKDNQIQQIT